MKEVDSFREHMKTIKASHEDTLKEVSDMKTEYRRDINTLKREMDSLKVTEETRNNKSVTSDWINRVESLEVSKQSTQDLCIGLEHAVNDLKKEV